MMVHRELQIWNEFFYNMTNSNRDHQSEIILMSFHVPLTGIVGAWTMRLKGLQPFGWLLGILTSGVS